MRPFEDFETFLPLNDNGGIAVGHFETLDNLRQGSYRKDISGSGIFVIAIALRNHPDIFRLLGNAANKAQALITTRSNRRDNPRKDDRISQWENGEFFRQIRRIDLYLIVGGHQRNKFRAFVDYIAK